MIKRIFIILALCFKLIPGQEKADAIHAQIGEEDPAYYLTQLDCWMDPQEYDWDALWDFVDMVNDLIDQENFENWANEWIDEWSQGPNSDDDIWETFYDEYPDGDLQDWLDYQDYLNNLYTYNYNNSSSCPSTITFYKKPLCKYGFDELSAAPIVWKAVEQGKFDNLGVTIAPASTFTDVAFQVVNPTQIAVSPSYATSADVNLIITGPASVNKAEAEIKANCPGLNGTTINTLKTITYTQVTKTVAVRLVHSASHTGYSGYTSTNISDADIIDMLNIQVYNQGVVKWTVSRLPDMTVDFDANSDGKIEVVVSGATSFTSEEITIKDACKDDSYDGNVFIVDNCSDGHTGGESYNSNRYTFVFPNTPNNNAPYAVAHELGHSVFGFNDLIGPASTDTRNFMWWLQQSPINLEIRKWQWDLMH